MVRVNPLRRAGRVPVRPAGCRIGARPVEARMARFPFGPGVLSFAKPRQEGASTSSGVRFTDDEAHRPAFLAGFLLLVAVHRTCQRFSSCSLDFL